MTESQDQARAAAPEDLRATARALEEATAALAELAETPFPLTGSPQAFTRESPEDRALIEGLDALAEESARASTTLNALAAAQERGLEIPPILLAPFRPYLDAFAAGDVSREGRGEEQAEQPG